MRVVADLVFRIICIMLAVINLTGFIVRLKHKSYVWSIIHLILGLFVLWRAFE